MIDDRSSMLLRAQNDADPRAKQLFALIVLLGATLRTKDLLEGEGLAEGLWPSAKPHPL
jgi:hypothetical protein